MNIINFVLKDDLTQIFYNVFKWLEIIPNNLNIKYEQTISIYFFIVRSYL